MLFFFFCFVVEVVVCFLFGAARFVGGRSLRVHLNIVGGRGGHNEC